MSKSKSKRENNVDKTILKESKAISLWNFYIHPTQASISFKGETWPVQLKHWTNPTSLESVWFFPAEFIVVLI